MVFTQLSHDEKDAFFSLLDEYFQSRPQLLSHAESSEAAKVDVREKAASVASAASRFLSPTPPSKPPPAPNRSSPAARTPDPVDDDDEEPPAAMSVAARAAAFGNRGLNAVSAHAPTPTRSAAPGVPPPMPPRRTSSGVSVSPEPFVRSPSPISEAAPPPVSRKSTVQVKKFGDVDMSSAKNMFSTIRNGTANKSKSPPAFASPVPAAFGKTQNTFGPPPVRRVPSNASIESPAPNTPSPPPVPARKQPTPEPAPDGEWAEALYDYDSGEAGDLVLRENARILVTQRTSDDWWTGESDGKTGLFPASYVKLL